MWTETGRALLQCIFLYFALFFFLFLFFHIWLIWFKQNKTKKGCVSNLINLIYPICPSIYPFPQPFVQFRVVGGACSSCSNRQKAGHTLDRCDRHSHLQPTGIHPSWFEPQTHSVGSSSPALFACLLLPELVFSSQCLLSPLGTSWCTLKVSFLLCLVLLLFPSFSTDEMDRRVELMRAGHMYIVLSSPLSVSVGLIPHISALWSSWYIFCCIFVSFWTVCNLLYCLIHIDLASLFRPAHVFCVWFISSA